MNHVLGKLVKKQKNFKTNFNEIPLNTQKAERKPLKLLRTHDII